MSKSSNTIKMRLLRARTKTRNGLEWRFVKSLSAAYSPIYTNDPLEAQNLIEWDAGDLVSILETAMSKCAGDEEVLLVDVELETRIEPVDMNGDDFLEIRRKKALKKLNPDDIAALGIEKLAAYNKLKFHGEDK